MDVVSEFSSDTKSCFKTCVSVSQARRRGVKVHTATSRLEDNAGIPPRRCGTVLLDRKTLVKARGPPRPKRCCAVSDDRALL